MDLDVQVCSRARLSRDPRFDGKFFIGVRASKVYCRPICPAPTAKEENCIYFATAAAAAEAGYRPCLRCRPECSPGTPGWLGTSNTVSRALRLIDETGLEDGVDSLAERLGVGSRHLRRLFLRHLGATPSAVANTRRLHFAKKLIDETTLPMNQIAIASGFGCVRRFNAAIRDIFQRTPTQIRSLVRVAPVHPDNQYVFRLHYRPPYDWEGVLEFLAARATPGVELVENGTYCRSTFLDGQCGWFEVSLDRDHDALSARVSCENPRALFTITERIRAMFDLDADWAPIARGLSSDPALRGRIEARPGFRVPGCWDGFELTVRAILGQQITVRAATTFAGRIAEAFGERCTACEKLTHLFPTPQALATAPLERIGLTSGRAETIRSLASAIDGGELSFERVTDTNRLLEQICGIRGIGRWTAQYVAMRALREPDAFPSSDRALMTALGVASAKEMERRSELWRPWRSYAVMYLWRQERRA